MKKFFYSIITMFLSFNMMNPTFVKASEKREIKSNKNIIIMVDQNSEKRAIIPCCIYIIWLTWRKKWLKPLSDQERMMKNCLIK